MNHDFLFHLFNRICAGGVMAIITGLVIGLSAVAFRLHRYVGRMGWTISLIGAGVFVVGMFIGALYVFLDS